MTDRSSISIIAVDPGGTTGVAVWDAWDQRLYVDQLDAGRGRKARLHVHSKVESQERRAAEMQYVLRQEGGESHAGHSDSPAARRVRAGRGIGQGLTGEREIIRVVESGMVAVLLDIVMACGPVGLFVYEDFVLGLANGGQGGSGGREGLSPVRITTRMDERFTVEGVWTGDAWRQWLGHWWKARDPRGWWTEGEVPPLIDRIVEAERYRFEGNRDEDAVMWRGDGWKAVAQMPSERFFIKGGKAASQHWLRGREQWRASTPHGMDALLHLLKCARSIGVDIREKPIRIWHGSKRVNGKGKNGKSF